MQGKTPLSGNSVALMVNLLSSLFIAIANIIVGRLFPNAPKDILDAISICVPIVMLSLLLVPGLLNKLKVIIWNFGNALLNQLVKRSTELKSFEIGVRNRVYSMSQLPQLQSTKINPSTAIVLITTMIIIVGFGIVIRWLFAGNIQSAPEPIYGIYHQIYNFTSP